MSTMTQWHTPTFTHTHTSIHGHNDTNTHWQTHTHMCIQTQTYLHTYPSTYQPTSRAQTHALARTSNLRQRSKQHGHRVVDLACRVLSGGNIKGDNSTANPRCVDHDCTLKLELPLTPKDEIGKEFHVLRSETFLLWGELLPRLLLLFFSFSL